MNRTQQLDMGARPDYATPILALLKDRPRIDSGQISEAIKCDPFKVRKAISGLLGKHAVKSVKIPKKGNHGYSRVYVLNPGRKPPEPKPKPVEAKPSKPNTLFTVWSAK